MTHPTARNPDAAPLIPLSRHESGGLHFLFTSGDAPSEHAHIHGQLVYSPSHLVTVVAGQNVWLSSPELAVWLPPQLTHQVNAANERQMNNVYLAPELARRLPDNPCGVRVGIFLKNAIAELCEGRDRPTGQRQRMIEVIVDEIQNGIIGGLDAQPAVQIVFQDQRLQQVANALLENPSEGRTLDLWARDVGVGRRTLLRLIKAETGVDWRQWRQRLLMAEAARRLAAGALVKTVAYELGYAGSGPFITAFRRLYGITPGRAYS